VGFALRRAIHGTNEGKKGDESSNTPAEPVIIDGLIGWGGECGGAGGIWTG